MRDTAQQRSIINVLGPSVQNTTIIFIVRFYLSSPSAEMVVSHARATKQVQEGAWLQVRMDFGYSFVMPYFSRISKATKRKEM